MPRKKGEIQSRKQHIKQPEKKQLKKVHGKHGVRERRNLFKVDKSNAKPQPRHLQYFKT